ncbi:MAG: hypothetical protein AB7V46_10535, partial [Thermomicrobiales bacterium]
MTCLTGAYALRWIGHAGVERFIAVATIAAVACRAAADPAGAGVGIRAIEPVVAGGAVGRIRVRAEARRGIARPGDVTLIERGADRWSSAATRSGCAGFTCRAGIAVVAGGAVGRIRVRAEARRGIARPGDVTLIERG